MAQKVLQLLLDSSTEEEESDTDEEFLNLFNVNVTDFNLLDNDIILEFENLNDDDFKEKFCFERATLQYLIADYAKSERSIDFSSITPNKEIYIFILRLTSNKSISDLSSMFNISKSTVSAAMKRVRDWVESLADEYLKWPDPSEIENNCKEFEAQTRIPGVVGCIDTTHVKVKLFYDKYRNSHKYYSFHWQAVVDAQLRFIAIDANSPGSYSDTAVLFDSEFYKNMQKNQTEILPNETFILGDRGYPLLNWLITPFDDERDKAGADDVEDNDDNDKIVDANDLLTDQQQKFNELHETARNVTVKAFSMLKSRFKSFLRFQDEQNLPKMVKLCCILHNICIKLGDEVDILQEDEENFNQFDEESTKDDGEKSTERREKLLQELINSKII